MYSGIQRKPASWGIYIFILSLILSTPGCSSVNNLFQTKSEPVNDVVTVYKTNKLTQTGELYATNFKKLVWNSNGVVGQVNVKVGQSVKKGDLLATLTEDSQTYEMKQTIKNYYDLENTIEKQKQDISLYQETADVAVDYFQSRVEDANKNLIDVTTPRASKVFINSLEEDLSKSRAQFKKFINSNAVYKYCNTHISFAFPEDYVTDYYSYCDYTGIGYENDKKLADIYLLVQSNERMVNYYKRKFTAEEKLIAKISLRNAERVLQNAKVVQNNIKSGDLTKIFGYQYQNYFTAYPISTTDNNFKYDWYYVPNQINADFYAAKNIYDQLFIYAPYDGTIANINCAAGDVVAIYSECITIIDPMTLHVRVNLDEKYVKLIQKGDDVIINLSGVEKPLIGEISIIDPIAQESKDILLFKETNKKIYLSSEHKVQFTVSVTINPKEILEYLGTTASVEFTLASPIEQIMVPKESIQRNSTGYYVTVINDPANPFDIPVIKGNEVDSFIIIQPREGNFIQSGDHVKIIAPVITN